MARAGACETRRSDAPQGRLDLGGVLRGGPGVRGEPRQDLRAERRELANQAVVAAAAEDPPGPLMQQLRVGGIMVVPVGQSDHVQSLIKVRRLEKGYDYEELRPVRFVPLLEGMAQD